MKIGYIMEANSVDMSSASGPQQHVKSVIEGLMKRGHTVRLLAFQNNKLQWTDDLSVWHSVFDAAELNMALRVIESPIRFIQGRFHLPFFRFFDSLRFCRACLAIFKDFDILYERDGTMSYGGLMASRKLGAPIVLEVNGDLIEEWEHMGLRFSRLQKTIITYITWMTYKYVSRIISVGETLKKRLINKWNLEPEQIIVVTNGANVQRFLEPSDNINVWDKYSLPEGPCLAFSGGFQPWHGIDLILQGFKISQEQNPDLNLILIGDGPERKGVETLIERMDIAKNVLMVGKVPHDDVANLLHSSIIAIIYHRASAAEIVETPLKLFEYMASGKAIIAPDVPNMRRILADHKSALLVPPDDPAALAGAIDKLLHDPELRTRLGKFAQKEAIAKHSWDRVVSDLEGIFEALVKQSSPRLDV